jgi:hypothetical protein
VDVIASGVALMTRAIAQYAAIDVHTAVAASMVPMICRARAEARTPHARPPSVARRRSAVWYRHNTLLWEIPPGSTAADEMRSGAAHLPQRPLRSGGVRRRQQRQPGGVAGVRRPSAPAADVGEQWRFGIADTDLARAGASAPRVAERTQPGSAFRVGSAVPVQCGEWLKTVMQHSAHWTPAP